MRELYSKSGLSIRPKTKLNKLDIIKGVILSLDMNPDEILSKESFMKPHRTVIDPLQRQEEEYLILSRTIKNTLIEELRNSRY